MPDDEAELPEQTPTFTARFWAATSSCLGDHWITTYHFSYLTEDLVSALTLSTLVIPQAISYAMLANVDSVVGLYTTIISGFIYMLLGTDEFTNIGMFAIVNLITGQCISSINSAIRISIPTINIAIWITFTTGILQLLVWAFNIPKKIHHLLPEALLRAFTKAAAISICISQLHYFFGLDLPPHAISFSFSNIQTIFLIVMNIMKSKLYEIIFSFGTLTFLIIIDQIEMMPKFKSFSVLVSIIMATAITKIFSIKLHIIGNIPSGFPLPLLPWKLFLDHEMTVSIALTICAIMIPYCFMLIIVVSVANLSITEAFPSAGKTSSVNSQMRVISIITIISSFFYCLVPSASLTRSALLHRLKARSPICSGIVSILVLLIIFCFTDMVGQIPLSCLAGIIIFCLYPRALRMEQKFSFFAIPFQENENDPEREHLLEESNGQNDISISPSVAQQYLQLLKTRKDCIIYQTTFFSVLIFDAGFGIFIGILASTVIAFSLSNEDI